MCVCVCVCVCVWLDWKTARYREIAVYLIVADKQLQSSDIGHSINIRQRVYNSVQMFDKIIARFTCTYYITVFIMQDVYTFLNTR